MLVQMGLHTVTRVFLLPVVVFVLVSVLTFFNFPPLVCSRSMHCDPVGQVNPSHVPFRTHTADLFILVLLVPVPLPLSTHSASNGQLDGQVDGLTHSALDDRPRRLLFIWHS